MIYQSTSSYWSNFSCINSVCPFSSCPIDLYLRSQKVTHDRNTRVFHASFNQRSRRPHRNSSFSFLFMTSINFSLTGRPDDFMQQQQAVLYHGVAVPDLYFKINSQYFQGPVKFVPVGNLITATDNKT